MGSLTDDMTRLCDEIGALRQSRFAFLGQLQQDAASLQNDVEAMRSRFGDQHGAMARELKDELAAFVSGIREYVNTMADEVFDLQEGFQNKHAAMASALRDELRGFSSGLNVDVTQMLEGFFNRRTETAEKAQADLGAFINGLKKEVSELSREVENMQTGLRTDHAEMARRMRDNLGDFVSALKEQAMEGESRFREDRLDMAREGRIRRELFLSEVRESVSELRRKVADLRAAFATDVENAHRAWASTSAPPVRREEAPVEKAIKTTRDDLTQISGIGLGRQRRLNEAGILTLQQLAGSTPEALHEALGKVDKGVNVEKWIEQAKALV